MMPAPVAVAAEFAGETHGLNANWLRLRGAAWILAAGLPLATSCGAADMTAGQLTQLLFKAVQGAVVDLNGKDLRELDLAGVDFKAARLAKADLYGADLADANLADTDLSDARLDRAIITRSSFAGAKLDRVTIYRPTIFSGLERDRREAPRFTGATLTGARLSGWLDGSDFSKADLTGAVFGAHDAHSEGLLASRVRMAGCDFSEAVVRDTDFHGSSLVFARFVRADARGADFRDTDLARADFSGADVAGMNVAGANLDEANFSGARGLDALKGLAEARNADRIIR